MFFKSNDINSVVMTGTLAEEPVWSYRYKDEHFYITHLLVKRLSGVADVLPLTIPGHLLVKPLALAAGERITIKGQLRSYNRATPQGGKLMLTVFVREFVCSDRPDENRITLQGTLCRMPVYRTTPLGRTISDLLIAVNRAYHHADYLPAIAWGEGARMASQWPVGTVLRLTGRFQSREYIKQDDDGSHLRIAYEVSASKLIILSHQDP